MPEIKAIEAGIDKPLVKGAAAKPAAIGTP
jgi:hypothetical protein